MFLAILLLLLGIQSTLSVDLNTNRFPDDFKFGVATASYQIEGAWNEDGKSENIWDHLTHSHPELIADGSNGDIACDSYHHIDEDVALMKSLGVDFYRFSISWARILPSGYSYNVNEKGIEYYNNLINALLANGIEPVITMYHWDLPQKLQDLGGWANPQMVNYFRDYARVLYEKFGDRVKTWITFNEPAAFCSGYGSSMVMVDFAPVDVKESGIGEYLCARTMLLSHAGAYHLYNDSYRETQSGKVGITFSSTWYEANSTSEADQAAADRDMQFMFGLYAHPIFSEEGDYPVVVREAVAKRSTEEGFSFSRLPELSEEEIKYIRRTADFFGLNHYTTNIVADREADPIGEPSVDKDKRVNEWYDSEWKSAASSWLKVVPWGFTKMILWIKENYNNPNIMVTENGFSDNGELEDAGRTNYYQLYLSALLDVLEQGANVTAYTAWSLLDNFEWNDGYTNRFGLHYVNMSDPARPRTAKASASYYKQVISSRVVTTE